MKAFLEGVRLGTIEPDSGLLRFLELEAKVYGLTTGKNVSGGKSGAAESFEDSSVADILKGFGKSKPFSAKAEEKAKQTKRKRGAPRKTPLKKTEEVE